MKSVRIYIDGVEADVPQSLLVPITFQYYSPLTPEYVRFAYSNEFTLPPTSVNRLIFGLADVPGTRSNVNKVRRACRVVQDGFEIIPVGYIVVSGIDSDGNFRCLVYSIDGDLYTAIKDLTLNDLDYTDKNQQLLPADIYGLRNSAEIAGGDGEVFTAVINLGNNIIDNAGTVEYIDNYYIITPPYVDSFIPIFFGYKQILQRIISQAGFTYDFGELVGVYPNAKFNSLAVMQAGYSDKYRFQYSDKFRESVEFSAITDANESFVNIGTGATRVLQFKITLRPCDFYDPDPAGAARSRYTVSNSDTAVGYYTGTFRFTGVVNLSAGAAKIALYKNGVQEGAHVTLAVGDNTVDLSVDANTMYLGLKDGDIFEIRAVQTGANPCTITYYTGCKFEFECFGAGMQYIYLNQIMPQINQLDFYKDFLFRFGQLPRQIGKKMAFKSLKEVLASTTFNDWTGKRVNESESTDLHLPLAQRNYYEYEAIDDGLTGKYGSGYFDLDDASLPVEATMVSIWGSTLDTTIYGVNCANIPGAQDNYDAADFPKFKTDVGSRLFLTRQKYTKEPNIYMDPARLLPIETDYTVACFTKLDTTEYERSLGYDKVLKEWYTTNGDMDVGFLARLKNAKPVIREYRFTAMDIATYNPHLPILDKGQIFMFPTFKSFVPDKVTEVEMLML